MHLEFVITISTLVIGILGIFIMMLQLNHQIISKIDDKFAKIDDKFNKIDDKFSKIDEKFDKLDEKINTVNNNLSNRIDKLYTLMNDFYRDIFKKSA